MKRNIFIAYLLTASRGAWFWLGIWVFYYLKFTNYAGIGLIETILILTVTLAEIPTGAVADLFGKKKTLILSFIIQTFGMFMLAATPTFAVLALSVFILGIGQAFFSGTLEALVFDSLKQEHQEETYDRKITNIKTVSLILPAVCGVIGGFLYKVNFRLPFYLSAWAYLLGLAACFFLTEPIVDTLKFSLTNFFVQTKQGFKELVKTGQIRNQTLILLGIGFIVVILEEMTEDFLGVEFGFNGQQLGVLWSIIFVFSALVARFTPKLRKKFKDYSLIFWGGILISVSLLTSPFLGMIAGGLILAFRSSLMAIFESLVSIVVNNNTESKYRATTLSTFNMIKNTPYVLTAYFIGRISDTISAKNTAVLLGITLFILLVGFGAFRNEKK